MTTPSFVKESIEIHEEPDGWRGTWILGQDAGREFKVGSAVEAQKSVGRHTDSLAQDGVSTILTVDWYPTTKIGRQVLRAIGVDEPRKPRKKKC